MLIIKLLVLQKQFVLLIIIIPHSQNSFVTLNGCPLVKLAAKLQNKIVNLGNVRAAVSFIIINIMLSRIS